MEAIKILVADDHPIVRYGLRCLLEEQDDFRVLGEASNGLEAVERARELQPDIILMDIRMPELDGLEAMRRIRDENPGPKIIVLTTYDSDDYIFEAIEAGAKGYILKDAPREEVFRALRAVHHGESHMDSNVTTRLLNRLAQLSHQAAGNDVPSGREIEVLRLMATGATNKEIAAILFISSGTARSHVANILRKLGSKDRTEAVTKAIQRGIISLSPWHTSEAT